MKEIGIEKEIGKGREIPEIETKERGTRPGKNRCIKADS